MAAKNSIRELTFGVDIGHIKGHIPGRYWGAIFQDVNRGPYSSAFFSRPYSSALLAGHIPVRFWRAIFQAVLAGHIPVRF